MKTTITIDLEPFEAGLKVLGDEAPKAVRRALNRTALNVRTVMVRRIAQALRAPQKTVRDQITTSLAANGKGLVMRAVTHPIPLIRFGARGPEPSRGRGRGVTARTKTRRYPKAFITTVKGALPTGVRSSGHRGVFVQVGDKVRRSQGAWSNNLRIRELKEASIWAVWVHNADEGQRRADEMLPKNLKHEVDWLLQQRVQAEFNRAAGVKRRSQ